MARGDVVQDVDNLENAGLSARDSRLELVHKIANAEDVSSAALSLQSHLKTFNAHLLSVKFCDTTDPGTTIRPFCIYPDSAIVVSQQIQVLSFQNRIGLHLSEGASKIFLVAQGFQTQSISPYYLHRVPGN